MGEARRWASFREGMRRDQAGPLGFVLQAGEWGGASVSIQRGGDVLGRFD
jgi:hypothetical protein